MEPLRPSFDPSTPGDAATGGRRLRGRLLDGVAAAEDLGEVARAVVGELTGWLPDGAWALVLERPEGTGIVATPPLGPALSRALERLLEDAADPGDHLAADLADDPLWAGDRRPFAEAGFAAAWAMPVERGGEAAAAWVVHLHDGERRPTAERRGVMEISAALAGAAFAAYETRRQVHRERYFDPLTRLPNRRRFHDELARGLAHADPRQTRLAVLMVDLDRFGVINETLGLAIGDMLLTKVAERLRAFVGPRGLAARIGDDEFALLLSDVGGESSLEETCGELLRRLGRPHDFRGEEMFASASVGVSVYPWHGEDSEVLIRGAEKALAVAKRKGRNRHQLYSPVLGTADHHNLQLLSGLPGAAERGELELLYQAQVSAASGEVVGAEALVYWQHPQFGRVSPGRFVPLAEDTGLMGPITDWVLERAATQAGEWRAAGLPPFRMAINVSPLQFRDAHFLDRVSQLYDRGLIDPGALEVEITESTAMTDVAAAAERCRALARLGVAVAIDDFGTGHSSLASLKRLAVGTLKIDRSFVRNVPVNHESSAIVEAILALASALSLDVVAEGVETRQQAAFLRQRGCRNLQGYLFGRPATASAFSGMLRANLDRGGRCIVHPAFHGGDDPLDDTQLLGPRRA